MPFEDPRIIVGTYPVEQRLTALLTVAKRPDPEQRLLEGTEESFDAAISFGCSDEGRGRFDPEELDLSLEVIAHVGAAMIVPQLETGRDALLVPTETLPESLAHWLERLEAVAFLG